MAYEPTQWRSGDTITSERLNKMEQGIAGSGEFYALLTNETRIPPETEGGSTTYTYSNVEFREDGMPVWLIVSRVLNDYHYTAIYNLTSYDNDYCVYSDFNENLYANKSTGEVSLTMPAGYGGTSEQ